MPAAGDDQSSSTGRTTDHRRAYKACIACRERKAKCDLAGRDGPPCVRCRRGLRECVFPTERPWPKKRKTNHDEEYSSHERDSPGGQHRRQSTTSQRIMTFDEDSLPQENQDCSSRDDPTHDLARSVMQTVVSSGNDALNLLFQAAGQNQNMHLQNDMSPQIDPPNSQGMTPVQLSLFGNNSQPIVISPSAPDVHRLWRSFRFVKEGWVSAEEVVTYIDLFFKNMAPLSPVLTDHFADHSNHYQLVKYEPLLCCTILMLSSRHHILPGLGGASRSYYIHDRFFKHCQSLISRLVFGQEKGSLAKTRTVGSIEALLLLTEWHPRALHFPPESDGWDSDLLLTALDDSTAPASNGRPPNRWLEDVIEPARRSDRMSWMLLGCALSLAHELNIFDDGQKTETMSRNYDTQATLHLDKRARTRRLLYVFMTQLSLRLGTMSMLPHNLPQILGNGNSPRNTAWQTFMLAWIELTKLLKSVSDLAFPSKSFTQELFRSGRYVSLLEHFQLLLKQWSDSHLGQSKLPEAYQDLLFIEFQYARIYCNSVGMQAVCNRFADNSTTPNPLRTSFMSSDSSAQSYVEEVITGSCDLLRRIVRLADKGVLHLAPVRTFLRLATSSVYLLKAMSVGVRPSQLQAALQVLQQTIDALNSCGLDEMHLANSYATLLTMHIKRLKKRFLASSHQIDPSRPRTRQSSPRARPDQNARTENDQSQNGQVDGSIQELQDMNGWDDISLNFDASIGDNDWMSFPFDPAMAPFGASGEVTLPADLDIGLDFIWNLPT